MGAGGPYLNSAPAWATITYQRWAGQGRPLEGARPKHVLLEPQAGTGGHLEGLPLLGFSSSHDVGNFGGFLGSHRPLTSVLCGLGRHSTSLRLISTQVKLHSEETGWVGYGSQELRGEEGAMWEPGAPGRSWWGRRGLEGVGLASLTCYLCHHSQE